jgi:acetyl esterase
MDKQFELDDKMSEETKTFVSNTLKAMNPADIIKLDTRVVTKFKEDQYEKLFSLVNFDHLTIDEFHVKSEKDEYEIPVTRYIPKSLDNPEKSSITVFFHGGGYCINSTKTHHLSIGMLASKSNSIWLSVGYRKCPHFQFPTPVNDCRSVLNWTLNNYENNKIGVCGDSSGAQIAAILAHQFKQKLSHQILIYPVVSYGGTYESYKLYQKDCYLLVPKVIKFFVDNLCEDITQHIELLDVINYREFANLAKCLIICAELDPLVDDSRNYYEKLIKENINCEFFEIKGTIHGFFRYFCSLIFVFKTFYYSLGYQNDNL